MQTSSSRPWWAVLCVAGLVFALWAVRTDVTLAQAGPADPPADLRPLLSPPRSELQIVANHYVLDRQTLDGNYAGASGGRGGRGRGAGRGAATGVVPVSPARLARLKRFDLNWQQALGAIDASGLSANGRADLEALQTTIASNLDRIEADAATLAALGPLLPFTQPIVDLVESRIRIEEIDARRAAGVLTEVAAGISRALQRLDQEGAPSTLAAQAATAIGQLRRDLDEWLTFFNGYDPLFTWWVPMPYEEASGALDRYAERLRSARPPRGTVAAASSASPVEPAPQPAFADVPDLETLIALPSDELTEVVARFRAGHGGNGRGRGARTPAPPAFYRGWLAALETLDFGALSRNAQVDYLFIRRTSQFALERAGRTLPANPPRKTDDSGIPGAARGREGLLWDLADNMIPYTPEELIVLADREFAWVEAEMIRNSRELGFGDDWKAAVEHVKGMHPPPGGQPAVIKDLMFEAVDYLREHDLLSVPQVGAESLHMIMMTPERQLVNPFFTGGDRISVSYPTNTMTYDQRLQSMRGNNTPFSHATAHHEMIPGHNLTAYVAARHAGYRADFGYDTPFFREGWALYWELLLYDRGFNDTPEERIGALFWRMHRCARIVFSLRFHMGQWSPQEAIDFLVDRVGHERENAIAEVRRSFEGSYEPLYQAAYLLGGLQIRSLHRELVESGRMTARAFHDEILRQGMMPIALLRAAVSDTPLARDPSLDWYFYGDLSGG